MSINEFLNKYSAIILICCVVFAILCTAVIVKNVKDVNKEGAECITDPLKWAEKYQYEKNKDVLRCSCVQRDAILSNYNMIK